MLNNKLTLTYWLINSILCRSDPNEYQQGKYDRSIGRLESFFAILWMPHLALINSFFPFHSNRFIFFFFPPPLNVAQPFYLFFYLVATG